MNGDFKLKNKIKKKIFFEYKLEIELRRDLDYWDIFFKYFSRKLNPKGSYNLEIGPRRNFVKNVGYRDPYFLESHIFNIDAIHSRFFRNIFS